MVPVRIKTVFEDSGLGRAELLAGQILHAKSVNCELRVQELSWVARGASLPVSYF